MRTGLALLAIGMGFALPALAQSPAQDDPQRQLGAHAHGLGKLTIAIEKRTVEMEIEAPGSDIVGFEHVAKTPEQKAAVTKARALLAKPLALFKMPDAAGCKVASAKVKVVVGGDHEHGHGRGKAAKVSKDKEAATPHSEFHAEYKLTCAKPELLQAIEFDYFKTFPGAQALDVSIIGGKGEQSKHKVSRDKPTLALKGTS